MSLHRVSEAEWAKLHQCRRRFFFAMVASMPVLVICCASTFYFTRTIQSKSADLIGFLVGSVVIISWFIYYVTAFLQFLLWRCPQCHRRFFGTLPFHGPWVFSKTCFYCNHGHEFTPKTTQSTEIR